MININNVIIAVVIVVYYEMKSINGDMDLCRAWTRHK